MGGGSSVVVEGGLPAWRSCNSARQAPGGGLRDRGKGWKVGREGRAEELCCVAGECYMLMCFLSVSSFHPASPLLSCSKAALLGATPSSSSRCCRKEGQGEREWRSRKAPAPI